MPCTMLEKQSKFPWYNIKCRGKQDTTWNILCSITFSPLHFMLYCIAESRIHLGQCSYYCELQKKDGEDGSDYAMLDNEWTAWEEGLLEVLKTLITSFFLISFSAFIYEHFTMFNTLKSWKTHKKNKFWHASYF